MAGRGGRCGRVGSLCTRAPSSLWPDVVRAAQAHACGVARTLADLGVDASGVAAGLLCDVLETTMMTEAQLRKLMPGSVVDIVVKVSKMSGICQARASLLP